MTDIDSILNLLNEKLMKMKMKMKIIPTMMILIY